MYMAKMAGGTRRRVLLVDDSAGQRRVLSALLRGWGYDVAEAARGDAALQACAAHNFDMVISDWVMPGLSGPEFCAAFRALPRESYGYFILLTAQADQVAAGLDAGADDFLAKPIKSDELRARLRAGERILAMQAELMGAHRVLRGLYDALDRDLDEARRLQQMLLRDRWRDFGAATVTLVLQTSGHVGGDLVGCMPPTDGTLAFYGVDVAGHGVAAAMLTVRLDGLFGGQDGGLLRPPATPAIVAQRLNRLMTDQMPIEQYLTMAMGQLDLATGQGHLVQAGHPHPIIQRAAGGVELLGQGGLPIGLFPDAAYASHAFCLRPGDRLVIPSDGFLECPGPAGDLGEEGLLRLLTARRDLTGPALVRALLDDLAGFAGNRDFPDDVSALILDYRGGYHGA